MVSHVCIKKQYSLLIFLLYVCLCAVGGWVCWWCGLTHTRCWLAYLSQKLETVWVGGWVGVLVVWRWAVEHGKKPNGCNNKLGAVGCFVPLVELSHDIMCWLHFCIQCYYPPHNPHIGSYPHCFPCMLFLFACLVFENILSTTQLTTKDISSLSQD